MTGCKKQHTHTQQRPCSSHSYVSIDFLLSVHGRGNKSASSASGETRVLH